MIKQETNGTWTIADYGNSGLLEGLTTKDLYELFRDLEVLYLTNEFEEHMKAEQLLLAMGEA